MKKKYVLTLVYQVQKDVEIEAGSLNEAREKALAEAAPVRPEELGQPEAFCKTLFVRDRQTGKTVYGKYSAA